jgi:hypothetical protein
MDAGLGRGRVSLNHGPHRACRNRGAVDKVAPRDGAAHTQIPVFLIHDSSLAAEAMMVL